MREKAGGREGTKPPYDSENAWSSKNHSILSEYNCRSHTRWLVSPSPVNKGCDPFLSVSFSSVIVPMLHDAGILHISKRSYSSFLHGSGQCLEAAWTRSSLMTAAGTAHTPFPHKIFKETASRGWDRLQRTSYKFKRFNLQSPFIVWLHKIK